MDTMDSKTLEYPIVRTHQELQMARGVDRTVLFVSALAAFFATLFAVLLLMEQPDTSVGSVAAIAPVDAPVEAIEEAVLPEPVVAAVTPLPDISAPPPVDGALVEGSVETLIPEAVPEPYYQTIRQTLEQLGVECREGNCFPE